MSDQPDVITSDDLNAVACTIGDVAHDYRPHHYQQHNRPHVSWRCVWCHVVACGDYSDPDPCMEPYHHRTPHRTRSGVTWPIGGDQP